MMTLRRYFTANYDWTGLAKKLYTSKVWEFAAIFLLAGIVLLVWALLPGLGLPTTSDGMSFNDLAPAKIVHLVDLVIAITLAGLLLSFVFNMYLKTLKSDKSLSLKTEIETCRVVANQVIIDAVKSEEELMKGVTKVKTFSV